MGPFPKVLWLKLILKLNPICGNRKKEVIHFHQLARARIATTTTTRTPTKLKEGFLVPNKEDNNKRTRHLESPGDRLACENKVTSDTF